MTYEQKILILLSDGKPWKVSQLMGAHFFVRRKSGFYPMIFVSYEVRKNVSNLFGKGFIEK